MNARTIYIAGPMTGHEGSNWPAFDAAAELWRGRGWEVVNPADLDREAGVRALGKAERLAPDDLLATARRDVLALIDDCDAIALMEGWEDSLGARAEEALATWLGKTRYISETGRKWIWFTPTPATPAESAP